MNKLYLSIPLVLLMIVSLVSSQLNYNNPNLPEIKSTVVQTTTSVNNNTVNVNSSNCWQSDCVGFRDTSNQATNTTSNVSFNKLDINGGTLSILNTITDTAITFTRSAGGKRFNFLHDTLGFYIYNSDDGIFAQTILNNGNVGIGTLTPTNKLQIIGTTMGRAVANSTTFFELQNPAAEQVLGFRIDSDGDGILDIRNRTGGSRITLNSNGNSYITGSNVGINTTTPVSALEVNGFLQITNGGAGMKQPSAGADLFVFRDEGNTPRWQWLLSSGDFYFYDSASASTRLFLQDNTGNVGIGTTTPSNKLDVRGIINASGDIYFNNSTKVGGSYWSQVGDYIHPNGFAVNLTSNLTLDNIPVILGGDALCINLVTNQVTDSGDVTCLSSSKNYKTNISNLTDADYFDILNNVTETPLFNWNYNKSFGFNPTVRHVGLIAEYSPDGVKRLDKLGNPNIDSINTLVGFTWASIKALNIKLDNLNDGLSIKVNIINESLVQDYVPYENAARSLSLNNRSLNDVNIVMTNNITIKQLTRLDVMTLPECIRTQEYIIIEEDGRELGETIPSIPSEYQGTIARNSTNIYMCNGDCWVGWGRNECG